MQLSDETLVSRVIATRDTDAFAELVGRHQGRIRGLLTHLARDPSLAQDLAQDTFVRAWERIDMFRGTGSFAAWLGRLAYNRFLQHERRRKVEARYLQASTPTRAKVLPWIMSRSRTSNPCSAWSTRTSGAG